jgi:RNA polymerase sigma factor (sigma-70 family)
VERRNGLLRKHIHDVEHASLRGQPLQGGEGAHTTDLALTLEQTVRELPERYQLAIYLRWHRELEYNEIGEILGVSAEAARKVINRALGMLRRQLREL